MAKARDGGAFTPQRIADYEDYRRSRPQMLRDMAAQGRSFYPASAAKAA